MHPVTSQHRPVRVTVVGGRGFLGSAITSSLRSAGHDVCVLDRDRPAVNADGLAPEIATSQWVIWAASSINPMIAECDPARVSSDTDAFESLLAALDTTNTRVLLLSSGGTVYDDSVQPPYSEDSPTVPRSAYGQAKLAMEQRLLASTCRPVILRISNAYGPCQRPAAGQAVIAHWLSAIAAGRPVQVFGDPKVARDYIHVADIAEAVRLVVERGATETVFNIGAGRATSLTELLTVIAATTDLPFTVEYTPDRSFDARTTWLDCTRAREVLGWRVTVQLDNGITDTWRWLRHASNPT